MMYSCISFDSYIKPQPKSATSKVHPCCISFDSYIKPQPDNPNINSFGVVYLLIPTSNHNHRRIHSHQIALYIF